MKSRARDFVIFERCFNNRLWYIHIPISLVFVYCAARHNREKWSKYTERCHVLERETMKEDATQIDYCHEGNKLKWVDRIYTIFCRNSLADSPFPKCVLRYIKIQPYCCLQFVYMHISGPFIRWWLNTSNQNLHHITFICLVILSDARSPLEQSTMMMIMVTEYAFHCLLMLEYAIFSVSVRYQRDLMTN